MNKKKIIRELIFSYRSLKEDFDCIENEKKKNEDTIYQLEKKVEQLSDDFAYETEDLQKKLDRKTDECNDLINELREVVKDRENDEDVIYDLTDRIQDLETLIKENLSEHAI